MAKYLPALLLALLAACGSKTSEVTVRVTGVQATDALQIDAALGRLPGYKGSADSSFKDGEYTTLIRYEGSAKEVAAELTKLATGLKNVKSFDETSVQVAWDGNVAAAAPPAATPAPAAPVGALPMPIPAPAPAVPKQEPPKEALKEIKVEVKKDPLAYKVHQLPAGTIATFDGWKVNVLPADANWSMIETHPEGKENDFQMIVSAGTPDAKVQSNLFEEGARYLQQVMPGLKPKGEPKPCTFGGDEARLREYTANFQGRDYTVQSLIIKKKDVAVALLAFGTEQGMKEYGRALGITAQSITVKESPPDAAIVGTWALEKYYSSGTGTSNQFSYSSSRSVTIYPNGTFTEVSASNANLNNTAGTTSAYLDGGDRGRVVKRGTTLSFHYDNGKVWNAEYKLDGGALVLNGSYYLKQ